MDAEASAKSRRLAFWSQANPVMPWDYRRGVRATAPKPIQSIITQSSQSNCHSFYPTVCIPPAPPDLNCGDIPYGVIEEKLL